MLVIIGVTQAGLFYWQLRVMRGGIEHASEAAAAAKASAEATKLAAEATREQVDLNFRPKIRIKHLWLTDDIWEGQQITATIVFVNAGTATAKLTEIGFATNSAKKQIFSNFPEPARVLPPGVSSEIKGLNDFRILDAFQHVKIRRGDARLYWAGYVEYQDRRGAFRKTSFCRVLELPPNATASDRGRFVKFDDPDYEYED